jgi:(p)ppGpp synthase/HD superfamily hydrolase
MKDFQEYWKALTYVVPKHEPKTRKDNTTPYIVHPLRVAMILRAVGFNEFTDSDLMIAALFHDLVEDTPTTVKEIENEFNAKIALTVKELTKPEQGNKDEWLKSLGTASKEAKIIKLADRIDNLMDTKNWASQKIIDYAKQGRNILETCGDAHPELKRKLNEVIETCIIRYNG